MIRAKIVVNGIILERIKYITYLCSRISGVEVNKDLDEDKSKNM